MFDDYNIRKEVVSECLTDIPQKKSREEQMEQMEQLLREQTAEIKRLQDTIKQNKY